MEALRVRLDLENRTLAAQEFCHTVQGESERVTDFVRRLEKAFQVAYGRDDLGSETRDTLLYGQLYEGLRYALMQAPAVSGCQTYKALCIAAKGEERRMAALKQRKQYERTPLTTPMTGRPAKTHHHALEESKNHHGL